MTLVEAMVLRVIPGDPNALGKIQLFLASMVLLMPSLMSSYAHYVELVEPADKRACIKCCDNNDDCPLSTGEFGCFSGYLNKRRVLTRVLLKIPLDVLKSFLANISIVYD